MDVAVVWKLRPDKTLEPVRIRTGITDHTVTEVAQVLNGQLNEGDELVTGAVTAVRAPRAPQAWAEGHLAHGSSASKITWRLFHNPR